MRDKVFLTFLWILASVNLVIGQDKLSKQEIIQRMHEGRYLEVYETLESNFKKFPKDAEYIYYTGVCRVQLNTNISEAVTLLEQSTKNTTIKESWFYLGRAYLLNYDFDNADEAFDRYNDKASRDEKEKVQFTLYLNMCRNARDICSRSKNISVLKVDTISEKGLVSFLNKQSAKWKFETTEEPGVFTSRVRLGMRYSSGNMVFQTKVPFGKKYKDIFFSDDPDLETGEVKLLSSVVNSPFEETFVFYDETIPALYFSSQGHNSSGEYDIFRSDYDKITKKWSKPVNMGFPINTPSDEIAYVTLPGTNKSLLVSDRGAQPGKLVVYTLQNVEDASEEPILTSKASEISKLQPGKTVSTSKIISVKEKAGNRNEPPAELNNEISYKKLIHEALNLQIRSDSVRRMSDEKKEQLLTAKTESEKTRLWQEIKVLDNKADDIQQKADVLYKKAREIEEDKERINTQELAQKAFSGKNKENTKSTEGKAEKSSNAKNDLATKIGVEYRIQVGVFSKLQPDAKFKGFSNVYKENLNNNTAFKYYVGLYKKVVEAEKELIKVKDAGFKDAYIIGFYKGKIVPLSRAREIENQNLK